MPMVRLEERIDRNLLTSAKTIGTTATPMFAGTEIRENRKQLIVYNTSSSTVYWGGPDVTTSNGVPLPPDQPMSFEINKNTSIDIYFVADADTEVRLCEI